MKRNSLFFNFRKIDGYNRHFNAVISERNGGKSSAAWLDKVYKAYETGLVTPIIRRRTADITDAYIDSVIAIFEKFIEDQTFTLKYSKTEKERGIVSVLLNDKPFIYIIALSVPKARLKSTVIKNIAPFMIFDEFICDLSANETYLKGEVNIFKELYNTLTREVPGGLKVYFLGNPYSLYNPYFMWWGVPTKELVPGSTIAGDDWVVEVFTLPKEIKEQILKENPLFHFEDEYKKYAFDGRSVNDENIKIASLLPGFQLKQIFRIESDFIGIYRSISLRSYHVMKISLDQVGKNRDIYVFEFKDVTDRSTLYTLEDRLIFSGFKDALRSGRVTFDNVNTYWLIFEIFNKL